MQHAAFDTIFFIARSDLLPGAIEMNLAILVQPSA